MLGVSAMVWVGEEAGAAGVVFAFCCFFGLSSVGFLPRRSSLMNSCDKGWDIQMDLGGIPPIHEMNGRVGQTGYGVVSLQLSRVMARRLQRYFWAVVSQYWSMPQDHRWPAKVPTCKTMTMGTPSTPLHILVDFQDCVNSLGTVSFPRSEP